MRFTAAFGTLCDCVERSCEFQTFDLLAARYRQVPKLSTVATWSWRKTGQLVPCWLHAAAQRSTYGACPQPKGPEACTRKTWAATAA